MSSAPIHSSQDAWDELADRLERHEELTVLQGRNYDARRTMLCSLLPTERIADYIVEVCYPRSLRLVGADENAPGGYEGADQLKDFAGRKDLTAVDLTRIATCHASYAQGDGATWNGTLLWSDFDVAVADMVCHPTDATPELLGSCCRLLAVAGWSNWGRLSDALTRSLLLNPATPVEVAARLVKAAREEQRRDVLQSWDLLQGFEALGVRLAAAYPDLADLPVELQCAVVETLPVPEGWQKNLWVQPAKEDMTTLTTGSWRWSPMSVWNELLPQG